MVLHHAVQKLEPEARQLREHRALVGDLVFQDVIERRDRTDRGLSLVHQA